LICACGDPEGVRQHFAARFMRHFNSFNFPELQDQSIQMISKTMLNSYLAPFDASIRGAFLPVADTINSTFTIVRNKILPFPSKSRKTFNMRDVSTVTRA
jgi:hypothetical protein